MLVWIIETLFAVIVSRVYFLYDFVYLIKNLTKVTLCGMFIEDNDVDGLVKIGYVSATCGLTSALYLLGIYVQE